MMWAAAIVANPRVMSVLYLATLPSMSSKEIIRLAGGRTLSGNVCIQGSKNAFHKILGACVRWPGEFTLTGIPRIQDAEWLLEQFRHVGGVVTVNGLTTTLDSRNVSPVVVGSEMAERSSGTILFAGALLARFGRVEIAAPGGDRIGYRPIGYHLAAFEKLGAIVTKSEALYSITTPQLRGGEFTFPGKTVNGTINAILAATGADQEVILKNCALESDIDNAICFMVQLGASIEIVDRGTGTIRVQPSTPKDNLAFDIIADRNATATYAVAAALAGDQMTLQNINVIDTDPLWEFLTQVGAQLHLDREKQEITISKGERIAYPTVVEGHIPPKFSTDWAPMVQVLLTQLPGSAEYHENVFSNRFAHVPELVNMGATAQLHNTEQDIWVDGSEFSQSEKYDRCRYRGGTKLIGTDVYANDIRNGAALVLAGMIAQGETTVHNALHLNRGYEDIVATLGSLGADISWG